jgi:hypothetical protein
MAKTAISEVEVLRFFETESIDKAALLYRIVADKMEGRLRGSQTETSSIPGRGRRRAAQSPTASTIQPSPTE